MKQLFAWIDSLINRLVTNVTLWLVGAVVVLLLGSYYAYSLVFIRLPQPPVYASYVILEPQRAGDTYLPSEPCAKPTPKPSPSPTAQVVQASLTLQAVTPSPVASPGVSPAATPGAAATPYAQESPLPSPCPQTLHQPDEWSPEQRARYYQTSQGSLVLPYKWFRALEWRTSEEMFASPAIQARYGLLPDNDATYNKDEMPVGIVKNIVRDEYVDNLGDGEKEWASISCAACHTAQITYKGTAMRIDGGGSFWNFDKWSGDLVFSLLITSVVPSKFERFCSRVNELKDDGRCSDTAKTDLRRRIQTYFASDLADAGLMGLIRHTYPTTEGFARTSALGRGVNGEFGPLDSCKGKSPLTRDCYRNYFASHGPVSFPPLWYTHEYDWVQSIAAISQPMGRNITEAWGVNVKVELSDPYKRFASTATIEDIFWMETLISILQAPKWPVDILGKIDFARVERGRYLYEEAVWPKAQPAEQMELPANPKPPFFMCGPNPNRPKTGYCASCHAPAFQAPDCPPDPGGKFLQLPMYRMDKMGTDPFDAEEFGRNVYPGPFLEPHYVPGVPQFPKNVLDSQGRAGAGAMLDYSINAILDRWFIDQGIDQDEECKKILEGHRPNIFRAPVAYPARPLDGYWATAPFLHNGSVRNMYELLSPVAERAKWFWVGSREFDPVYLGFTNEPVEGAFKFDTSVKGNSNAGHEFREAAPNTNGVIGPLLTAEQRLDIIEYLKVLRSVQIYLDNDPATKNRLEYRNGLLDELAPYYESNVGWYIYGLNKPKQKGTNYSMQGFCSAIKEAKKRYPGSQP
ncbi:MAG: di-heme-cytochrome C peroxidase [Pyrinomonadaceae bacterium]